MLIIVNNEIVKQVNTEKTHKLQDSGFYVFLFQKNIRKDAIKKIIEQKYAVKVDSINTINLPKKISVFRGIRGCLTQYKKAYVKVARGMKIDFNDSVQEK